MALVSNAASFFVVVLYWLYCFARAQHRAQPAPTRLWSRNFLYLWVTNVIGFGELVLLNPLASTPWPGLDDFTLIRVSILLLIGYGLYIVLLLPLTFNTAPLQVLEDTFIVGYAVVQSIILVDEHALVSVG